MVTTPSKPAPITVTEDTDIGAYLKDAKFPYRLKIVTIGTKIYVDEEEDFKLISSALRKVSSSSPIRPGLSRKTANSAV